MIELDEVGFKLMRLAKGCNQRELVEAAVKSGIDAEAALAGLRGLLDRGVIRFRGDGVLEQERGGALVGLSQSGQGVEAALRRKLDEVNALLQAAWAHGFRADVETYQANYEDNRPSLALENWRRA